MLSELKDNGIANYIFTTHTMRYFQQGTKVLWEYNLHLFITINWAMSYYENVYSICKITFVIARTAGNFLQICLSVDVNLSLNMCKPLHPYHNYIFHILKDDLLNFGKAIFNTLYSSLKMWLLSFLVIVVLKFPQMLLFI